MLIRIVTIALKIGWLAPLATYIYMLHGLLELLYVDSMKAMDKSFPYRDALDTLAYVWIIWLGLAVLLSVWQSIRRSQ